MSEITITLDQLRGLIGILVQYRDVDYQVIEVLEDRPSIVLQTTNKVIQPDSHGNPTRWVPGTITVPVLTEDKLGLAPEFLLLELLDDPD
ncbi:MAG: hypothetical protein BMS9Abin26_0661 [Gammaproteobacteria bacterium]|nr:MAG: hypothetical protein BMS9Abin26_0661 [Gammaproteobacteria bacterium]